MKGALGQVSSQGIWWYYWGLPEKTPSLHHGVPCSHMHGHSWRVFLPSPWALGCLSKYCSGNNFGHFAAGVWWPEIDFTRIYSLIVLKERESGNQKNLELIHFLEHSYQLNPFHRRLSRLLLCARTRARFANNRTLTLGGAIWVCDRCVIFPFVGTETIPHPLSLCSVLENYLNKQPKFQGTQEIPQPAIRMRVRVRRHLPSTSSQTHSLIPKSLADLGGTSRLRASPEHYQIPPQFQPPPPNLS